MKTIASVICFLAVGVMNAFAQDSENDSLKTIRLEQVTVYSNRIPVTYQNNPGSLSLVRLTQLTEMPKGIGAEEVLRLVPGVRVDNQHNGERVHISMRGQGIHGAWITRYWCSSRRNTPERSVGFHSRSLRCGLVDSEEY